MYYVTSYVRFNQIANQPNYKLLKIEISICKLKANASKGNKNSEKIVAKT